MSRRIEKGMTHLLPRRRAVVAGLSACATFPFAGCMTNELQGSVTLNIQPPQGRLLDRTTTTVENEINLVYGIRSKGNETKNYFPSAANLALKISLKSPSGTLNDIDNITASQLWPAGQRDGEKEITRTKHIPVSSPGTYEIIFSSQYAYFLSYFVSYLIYGCWLGVAADNTPFVSKIWASDHQIAPQMVAENYTLTKV